MLATVVSPAVAASVPALNPQALQAAIDDLRNPPATSAQLRVSGSAGQWYGTSGVADTSTGAPICADGEFRIGSVTKVFVATVVLQLVAEHRVDLDTPIQHYLPGLLPASFKPITVAELLNHTSGLPNEVGKPDMSDPATVVAHRYDQFTPLQLVAAIPDTQLKFDPGTKQEYRGINYVLAAMLVEKVTGHHYGDEIAARILRPLRLTHTVVPGNDPAIHGPHVHGYLDVPGQGLVDITDFNQSAAWGEGEMISTTGDLDRFVTALFSGALLPPSTLEKMFTLPSSDVRMVDGGPASYSMGLQTITLNGVTVWGKTGERYGYNAAVFATRDQQRRLEYSFTPTHRDDTQVQMTLRIAQAATS